MQNAKCNMHIALCILDFGKHVANMFFCRKKMFFWEARTNHFVDVILNFKVGSWICLSFFI